ncbi:MAG: 5-formyltetrahydrofolate cyclo-ligase [Mariprofundus sp.]|nr:5-formyltetrahydrofolate cyclo-ligase [Mariprofundus sp.]
MNKPTDKNTLRASSLAYRENISNSERLRYSKIITKTLLSRLQSNPNSPSHMLVYRSLPSEVNTEQLFHLQGYQIFAPVTHHHKHMEWLFITPKTTWMNGLFGISEPASGRLWAGNKNTVLLCPLAAFDRKGNRLGMGMGCFDYWLSQHRHQLNQVIGLAFSGQEVTYIPAESHDAPMDCIITEKEVIECLKV